MPENPRNPNDRPEHKLPQPTESQPGHQLPWPQESDPRGLGDTFADAHYADDRKLGNAFADPNAIDDTRIGNSFAETQSSAKKHAPPLKDRVHMSKNRKPIYWFLIGFFVLFAIVLLVGWLIRRDDNKETKEAASREKDQKPVVEVTTIHRAKGQAGIALPGTTIPLTEAYVYARANGYLKTRLVDIGDHVRKNQLLAIIDAPDLDAQVAQAREQLRQAEQQLEQQKAQLALATVTVNRYRVLVAKGVFSRQEGDQQETNYSAQVANVAAAQRNVDAYRANLQRNIALQSYEYVRAPFAGVITQRNVDVGALISASGTSSGAQSMSAPQGQTSTTGGTTQAGNTNTGGSSGSPSTAATSAQSPGQGGPLFGIAQNERLRILVSVPEGYVTTIHPGGHAQLAFQEYSGVPYVGDITRTADSVDPNTRTMLTEVQVDNHQGKLIPGMYTVVTFPPPPNAEAPLLITGDAVAIRHDTSVIATVVNGKIHLAPVVLGRDYGTQIEVLNGVKDGDTVVTNVNDDVVEGAAVQVQENKAASPQGQQQPPRQDLPPGGSTQYSNQGITDQNLQGQQGKQNNKSSGGQMNNKGNSSNSESKP